MGLACPKSWYTCYVILRACKTCFYGFFVVGVQKQEMPVLRSQVNGLWDSSVGSLMWNKWSLNVGVSLANLRHSTTSSPPLILICQAKEMVWSCLPENLAWEPGPRPDRRVESAFLEGHSVLQKLQAGHQTS